MLSTTLLTKVLLCLTVVLPYFSRGGIELIIWRGILNLLTQYGLEIPTKPILHGRVLRTTLVVSQLTRLGGCLSITRGDSESLKDFWKAVDAQATTEAQRSWALTIAEKGTGTGKTNLPVRLKAGKASVSHLPFPKMTLNGITHVGGGSSCFS